MVAEVVEEDVEVSEAVVAVDLVEVDPTLMSKVETGPVLTALVVT